MMFYRQIHNSIILRSLEPEDAQSLFALIDTNREHLRAWLDWVDTTTKVEHVRSYCEKAVKLDHQGKAVIAAICLNDALCGLIELRAIDQKKQDAELGFWLGKNAQGRGMMATAVRVMIDYAFSELGLQTIFASCQLENIRSVHVLERNGFALAGEDKKSTITHGQAVDAAVFQRRNTETA